MAAHVINGYLVQGTDSNYKIPSYGRDGGSIPPSPIFKINTNNKQ